MGPPISVLILNHESSFDGLADCVASVDASDCPDLLEIVIVDNGSRQHDDAAMRVAAKFNRARAVMLGRNWGFSGGINRGIAECRGKWIFILNDDTEVDPAAVGECAAVLAQSGEACLGVAPKLLFDHDRHLIDAIGNAVDAHGAAFNVGIGQLDIGQYDVVERCFGPCFAACLLRKEAFDLAHVGPLDESFFMYYEDVDWNWRANLFGYHFMTAPNARVYHVHSGTARRLAFSFKYRHIERNLLTTVLKNAEGRRALRIWKRRIAAHARNFTRGRFRWESVSIVWEAVRRIPDTWAKRQRVWHRRVLADTDVVRLAHGEFPYFDPVTLTPQVTLANLEAMYRRKALVTGDSHWHVVARTVADLRASRLQFEPGFATSRLLPLLEGEPDYVLDFVRRLDAPGEASPVPRRSRRPKFLQGR